MAEQQKPDEAPRTVADVRAALDEEWSQYRANRVIEVNGARAFNPGDLVPASHVSGNIVPADAVDKITKG